MSVATEIERLQNAKVDIKTAIEEKGVTVGDGTIDTYADKIRKISGGSGDGYEQGYTAGIEQGKQEEFKRWWDTYCYNGTYTGQFNYAFAGLTWNEDTFKPPQTIRVKGTSLGIFRFSGVSQVLASQVDFSEATGLGSAFDMTSNAGKKLTYIELMNVPKCKNLGSAFMNNSLLESLTITNLREDCTFNTNTFANCPALTDLSITGIIGNTLNLGSCSSLNKTSLTNVMNILSNNTSGKTATFNKQAVDTAFETAEGLADGSTSQEWLDLIATKSNWTISLIE